MFNAMDAQSEIARRQEFVSSGMRDVQVLRSFVSKLVRRFRDYLRKAASDRLASQGRQSPVQGHYAQS